MSANTLCERLLSQFVAVSPTCHAAAPHASSAAACPHCEACEIFAMQLQTCDIRQLLAGAQPGSGSKSLSVSCHSMLSADSSGTSYISSLAADVCLRMMHSHAAPKHALKITAECEILRTPCQKDTACEDTYSGF